MIILRLKDSKFKLIYFTCKKIDDFETSLSKTTKFWFKIPSFKESSTHLSKYLKIKISNHFKCESSRKSLFYLILTLVKDTA